MGGVGLSFESNGKSPLAVWEGLALLAALGIATYLRLAHIDTTWMSPDQSALISLAMDIGSGKKFPLVANLSSVGLVHPVLPVYLYAVPLALTHQVISAAWLTALLNIFSLGIGYLYARQFLGRSASLIFLGLYTASPWSVHFSRLIWNPVMIPFFAALALWLLTISVTRNPHFIPVIGTALALMAIFHSHLISLPLLVGVGTIWLLFHRRLKLWWVAIALLLVSLSFLPYWLAQPNLRSLSGLATGETVQFNLAPFLIAGDLASGRGLFLATGGWKTAENLLRGWLWVSIAWLGAYTLRYGREAWRGSISAPQAARIVLFFWIVSPLLALLYQRHYLQHHYFLPLYPAVYLAMAALVKDIGVLLRSFLLAQASLGNCMWPVTRTGGVVLLLGSTLGWSLVVSTAILRQEQLQTCPQERQIRSVVDEIRVHINLLGAHNLVVLSDGIDASYSTLGFIGRLLPENISIRFTRLGEGLLVPMTPALHVVAGENPRTTALLDQIGVLLKVWDVGPCGQWRLYATPGGLSFASGDSEPVGEWANGLQLWGYQIEHIAPGENLVLTTFWRATAESPLEWDHFFFHLFSPSGQFISQMDGPGVSSPYWHKGDWLILFTTLPLPKDILPGRYEIYCGLYTWPGLERIPVIAGEATDNRLRLTEAQIP